MSLPCFLHPSRYNYSRSAPTCLLDVTIFHTTGHTMHYRKGAKWKRGPENGQRVAMVHLCTVNLMNLCLPNHDGKKTAISCHCKPLVTVIMNLFIPQLQGQACTWRKCILEAKLPRTTFFFTPLTNKINEACTILIRFPESMHNLMGCFCANWNRIPILESEF